MTEEQISELLALNPDGIDIEYEVHANASGEVVGRTVRAVLSVRSGVGLRNGVFKYCDEYATGEEVE